MTRTVIICSAMLIAFLSYLEAQAQPARPAPASSRIQFMEAGTLQTTEVDVPAWGGPVVDVESVLVVHDADTLSVGDAQLVRLFGLPLWIAQGWEFGLDGDVVTPQFVTYGLLSTDGFDLVSAPIADRRGRAVAVELLAEVTGQQLEDLVDETLPALPGPREMNLPARAPGHP